MGDTSVTGDHESMEVTTSSTLMMVSNSQLLLGSHQRLKDNALSTEAMDWLMIADSNIEMGMATFIQIVNTLENGIHADYMRWYRRFGLGATWPMLKKYIIEEHHGGASQWGLGYKWHQLAADRPIKEFNEHFLQLVTALGVEDTELAKGMYHAKMLTAIHQVIHVLEKDKTLKQLMHVAEDKVCTHLVSQNSSVMDINAVGYGGFITANTNKMTTNKGITIA
ncbi:hypothetical protein GGI17_006749, partial [Coemansia sp. S146]